MPTDPFRALTKPATEADAIEAPELITDEPSGEVTFDDLGNAVWDWRRDRTQADRIFRENKDESILDHIDIEDLKIVETKDLKNVNTVSGKLDIGQRFSNKPNTKGSGMSTLLRRLGRR